MTNMPFTSQASSSTAINPISKPIIGMLHLPALPGAPKASMALEEVIEFVLADAQVLVQGGCHALMLENFGDVPFFPGSVPPTVAALMTRLACEVKRSCALPLGINVLRNDGMTALAVAVAAGADFIRVNVLTGARVTDQGLIQGIAHELLRERRLLNAEHIAILADVDVKHSAPLASRPLAAEVEDTLKRGLADGVIVSGSGTGAKVSVEQLRAVKQAAGAAPVLIGSGASGDTLEDYWPHADGFIVGSAFKRGGTVSGAVDGARVADFVAKYQKLL